MLVRLFLVLLMLPGLAAARVLDVGPGLAFATPSAAARAAQDGDTILIAPGDYYDCAVWTRNGLTIAGTAPGVTITDTACQGKALFVIIGHDTTIRDLTLARARVPDRNGAGIRLEGRGLVLRNVRFTNNEVGILAGVPGPGAIRIETCAFNDGGVGGDRPTFAVWAGAVGLLRIEGSSFKGIKGGQILSAAGRTELIGNTIDTGTGDAPSVGVMATGGTVVLEDNRLLIGPNAPRLGAAVAAMGKGVPELRRNTLTNTTGQPRALLLNWTGSQPLLDGNRVEPGDREITTDGLARHMASVLAHGAVDGAHGLADWVKRGLGRR